MSATVPAPQFTGSTDLRYFLEPLGTALALDHWLERFPESLYSRSPDSHFMRFMSALLGPTGVGGFLKALTSDRLGLEQIGIDQAALDALYGGAFGFPRSPFESTNYDQTGLLPASVWAEIRHLDESYRSRAMQFLQAVRLGGTREGMSLAATSGAGTEVEAYERFRFLFDQRSDDPIGVPDYGFTESLREFTLVPRSAISQTEQQTVLFAQTTIPLGTNPFTLTFNGYTTTSILATATASDVQVAFSALPTVGPGNVYVTGGPAPAPFTITFSGLLSNQILPTLTAQFLSGTTPVAIPVQVTIGGVDPSQETVVIPDVAKHSMQLAIDALRPVNTYPTFNGAASHLSTQVWQSATATTAYVNVARFVTGDPVVNWPAVDKDHWLVASEEQLGPQLGDVAPHHYVGFHNPVSASAYTDQALADPSYAVTPSILGRYTSVHVGPFPHMTRLFPYFAQFDQSFLDVFAPERALADYPEPLSVTDVTGDGLAIINDIYPADSIGLQGVPTPVYHDDHFWASQDRVDGADILEIDLGQPQAVNYLSFEVTRKPISIAVAYDTLDQFPARNFVPVVPIPGLAFDNALYLDPNQHNPWERLEYLFDDGVKMLFTRFLRLTFTRRADSTAYGRFLYNPTTGVQLPWSIEVRNLRIGRNLAPSED